MALIPNLDLEELHRFKEGKPMGSNEIQDFFGFFIPKDEQFITAILVDLNIVVFLVMLFSGLDFFSPNVEQLLVWGACEREAVLNVGMYVCVGMHGRVCVCL